jgi:serine/threonine protein kinase
MGNKLSRDDFLRNLGDSGLLSAEEIDQTLATMPAAQAGDGHDLARRWVAAGKLTTFQAEAVAGRRFEELVVGNYHVLDRLGAGGMGTVYKARHRRMKRVVALKVLSGRAAADQRFVQRFQREVEAVARLTHPNIVMAHDADEAAVGPFLVMEFVNGRDLASEVAERGRLPLRETVDCIAQASRGLAYAHAQGIIHRDVKPANLLRDDGGVVKVADLGLARFSDHVGRSADEARGLTQAGTVVGTVDYMSPEQAMGLSTIDHRTDIYSLGCTLHFLLTGRPPFEGETLMATLLKHRDAPVPSLRAARPDVPAELDQVFQRMLAKTPDGRVATMAEVTHALGGLSLPADSPPPSQGAGYAPTVDQVAALPAASAAQTTDAQPATPPGSAGTTVLLVEPSRTQSLIIQKYLQELGFTAVNTVPSGKKALELARAQPPGVVICALHLSDMTAVRLAQEMRAQPSLALTGFVLISSQADAREANLDGGIGSIVRLAKPFGRDQLAAALDAATAGTSRCGAPDGPRVLVVDDSAAARGHIRRVLQGVGAGRVVEAANGAEARDLLLQEGFDLVVTDYNMPRLDGRGLVEFIRRYGPTASLPVVVVTTETNAARLEALRQLGVSAICGKDLQLEVIRRALGRPG